jgi:hypothetical protein
MTTIHATQADRDAHVLANAERYEVSLFLGRGKFARGERATLHEARELAGQLLADNPTCTRKPIVMAIDASGRAAPVATTTTMEKPHDHA